MQPTQLANLSANIAQLPAHLPAEFVQFATDAQAYARPAAPGPDAPVFTDDRAPVETLVDSLVLNFLFAAALTASARARYKFPETAGKKTVCLAADGALYVSLDTALDTLPNGAQLTRCGATRGGTCSRR